MEYEFISDPQIGQWLIEENLISQEHLDWALERSTREGVSLARIVISSGLILRVEYYRFLARRLDLEFFDYPKTGVKECFLDSLHLDFLVNKQCLPVSRTDRTLTVAMTNPFDKELIEMIKQKTGLDVKVMVTSELDILWALSCDCKKMLENNTTDKLAHDDPQFSAKTTFSQGHIIFLVGFALATLIFSFFAPYRVAYYFNVVIQLTFLVTILFKFFAVLVGLFAPKAGVDEPAHQLQDKDLPVYTILVPVFKEAKVLPQIIKSISEFDYPKSKLDVKLLFEENDKETLAVAKALNPMALFEFISVPEAGAKELPELKEIFSDGNEQIRRAQRPSDARAFFNLVVVPQFTPQTKPKACNWGLQFARGEYVTIYDAEDRPEPDQLKKVLYRLRHTPEKVLCVQASLNYYNPYDNFLTKMFTLEYSYWFDYMLPGLEKLKMPIPLGGTSNHFHCAKLNELGGWDPFNVTEDADLGIRAFRKGYEVRTAPSTTWEEANSELNNWMHQRTRWIKGYMVTFLVHTKNIFRTFKELGLKKFFGFMLFIGGTPLSFLIAPLLWGMFFVWLLTNTKVFDPLYPDWLMNVAVFNLIIGNSLMIVCNMIAVIRRKYYRLIPWAFLCPVYWLLCSVAAWRALFQLFSEPFRWEKTRHGLSPKTQTHIRGRVS